MSCISRVSGTVRGRSLSWLRSAWTVLVAIVLPCAGGCTSAISTAYLRDAWWDTADRDAEDTDPEEAGATDTAAASDLAAIDERADAERRAAAVDEAVARLKRLGDLDEATRTTLVETLQRTEQEDWPAVIEAFAASLETTAGAEAAAEDIVPRGSAAVVPASHVAAKADLDGEISGAPAPAEPVTSDAPEAMPATREAAPPNAAPPQAPAPVASTDPALPTAPAPLPPETTAAADPVAAPSLAVRNACFAKRVQGWGVVERFPSSRFRAGQEVIVYFELDHLSAGESPAGHTTCIDTTLTLVDGSGRVLHDWTFEPIAETCRARRHDYFARYVIRLPEDAAVGTCRLDLAVVDTLTSATARESLEFDIAAE
jgi:hypothetical protein